VGLDLDLSNDGFVGVTAVEDGFQAGADRMGASDKIHTGHVGHSEVGEEEVEMLVGVFEGLDGLEGAASEEGLETTHAEHGPDDLADGGVVFDDEDDRRGGSRVIVGAHGVMAYRGPVQDKLFLASLPLRTVHSSTKPALGWPLESLPGDDSYEA